jgi:hypothetical protein
MRNASARDLISGPFYGVALIFAFCVRQFALFRAASRESPAFKNYPKAAAKKSPLSVESAHLPFRTS